MTFANMRLPLHAVLLLLQGPARNRLLVKGGSSFNALIRAMKQDLIDSGTAAKDPALLYEIDKVGTRTLCEVMLHRLLCSRQSRAAVWTTAACEAMQQL